MPRIIDTHAHIYSADESVYPMKDDPMRPPEGTGGIAHLRSECEANGIHGVALVQTGSAYQWDNRLLADTAAANADWTRGVCTLDPLAEDSSAQLENLAREYNVKALRLEATREGAPRYDHEGSRRLFETARELNLVICAHIHRQFLPELDRLLEAFPEVSVVLDHCAYPSAAEGPEGETVVSVCVLSGHPNLNVKITFLVTASEGDYPFADTHEMARRIIGAYGAGRCMWGSDFPCQLWLKKASYAQHLAVVADEIEGLSAAEREALLCETPARVWFGGSA